MCVGAHNVFVGFIPCVLQERAVAEEEGEDLVMNLMEDTDEEVPTPPDQMVKSPVQ